jgi:Mrp family chromosome partitioning ATPase
MSKNFELLRQIGREHDLFQTPAGPSGAVKTADCDRPPLVEIAVPKPEPKEARQQIRRPELVKEKAKSSGQEVSRKNLPRGLEWARMTLREELKLVHRIFSPAGAQRAPQVVLFSGLEAGHAASAISARCCEVLAEQGDGLVCAVDANLESPFLHSYFGVSNEKGMTEALCDSGPVNEFVQQTKDSHLWVMPTGAANTGFDLGARDIAERLKDRMNELRVFFKYVLIHSPVCSDRAAAPPSFAVDGLVLIVEANSTRRERAREVMEELRTLGTPILGVVLNNRTFPIPDAIYHKL